MRLLLTAPLVAAAALAVARAAAAPDGSLTLEEALARAKERAPALLAARAAIEEARGRLMAASVRPRENPVLEAAAGPRRSGRDDSTDLDVEIGQTLEMGGRRSARVSSAGADLAAASAGAEEEERRLLKGVAVVFIRALSLHERLRLMQSVEGLADDLLRVARRRHAEGEVPALDVNLAGIASARARSETEAARGDLAIAMGDLKVLLGAGADDPIGVRGDLREIALRTTENPAPGAPARADVRRLEAEEMRAQADLRWSEGLRWTDLTLRLGYEREEDADIVLGGVSVPLPFFERGQGARLEASARARRLRIEREAAGRAVDVEVRSALEGRGHRIAAVRILEDGALPAVVDSESLGLRSYEAGQIGLVDLLLIRKEALETRLRHLDAIHEAALAVVELESRSGVLR